MEMKQRTWDRAARYPNMLLQELIPVSEAELLKEYFEIYDDLAERYYPRGPAEVHCVEMMATALWCERRAVSAEATAYSLEFDDQCRPEQMLRTLTPEGYSAAEQMAMAIDRMNLNSNFLDFLIRYKKAQIHLYEKNVRRLKELKADREDYEPKEEPHEALPNRLRAFNERQKLKEAA